MSDDEKPTKADRVDRKLTEIGSSLSDLLRNIRDRRMTLRQIRDELDAVRAQHDATRSVEAPPVAAVTAVEDTTLPDAVDARDEDADPPHEK